MSPLRKRGGRGPEGPSLAALLPAVPQEAELTLPELGTFDARVTRIVGEEAVIVVMLAAGELLEPAEEVAMALEFCAPRGLVRIEGRGAVTAHDVVRMRLAGAVEVNQRRDFVRVPSVRPMALAVVDEEDRMGAWIDTLTVNISGNGILASGPGTLRVGTRVRFRVRVIEGEPPIEGFGRVARASDAGHRGIAIEQLPDEDRRRLVAFIFERERVARRMLRDRDL